MEDQNKPVIDVIIPAYRPDDSFQKLIGLLQEQTVKPHHIYVLQTMGEGDELMQSMNSDMTVHSVAKKDFDHGATRDYGARLAAEGNQAASDRHYILFMTQDAVPANTHLIETLAKAFEDERTAIAYARQLIRENQMNFTQISEFLGYSSIHYFSRQFKKISGMTPTEYITSIKALSERERQ